MKSIANAVEGLVSNSPLIKELILLDIVNFSGLARQIKYSIEEEICKTVSEASVMVALKRLAKKMKPRCRKTVPKIFSVTPELTVRSNLFEITVKNSPTLMNKQKKLIVFANKQQNRFINFTYGLFETTTIASNKLYDSARTHYRGEHIVSEIRDISTLSIKFPMDIADSPFVYYRILRTISWSGISIIEMVSTFSELTLAFEQKDIELAFSLIKRLFTTSDKDTVSSEGNRFKPH